MYWLFMWQVTFWTFEDFRNEEGAFYVTFPLKVLEEGLEMLLANKCFFTRSIISLNRSDNILEGVTKLYASQVGIQSLHKAAHLFASIRHVVH